MECQVGMDIDADDVCVWAWTLMQTCLRVGPCIWANGGRWWSPFLGQKSAKQPQKMGIFENTRRYRLHQCPCLPPIDPRFPVDWVSIFRYPWPLGTSKENRRTTTNTNRTKRGSNTPWAKGPANLFFFVGSNLTVFAIVLLSLLM